jgi:DedD protein
VVQVAAVADKKEAEDLATRVKRAGFSTEIEAANVKGKTYYRVVAVGFGGQEQARSAATRIKQDLKLTETPWVSKR